MSDGSNRTDALPPDTSATEALEKAVEESRREYDKKVETMEEIDDKAMRSVRTAVILVGLVVSAVSVSGLGAVGQLSVLSILVGGPGVVALVVSIIFGIGVYSTTEYPTGIDSDHRADVIPGGYSREEWLVHLLDEYDQWSDKLADEISQNTRYFELVQVSLSLGILSLLASASMVVVEAAYGVPPSVTFSGFLVGTFTIRTYLSKKD